jgi:hypothetical protein
MADCVDRAGVVAGKDWIELDVEVGDDGNSAGDEDSMFIELLTMLGFSQSHPINKPKLSWQITAV